MHNLFCLAPDITSTKSVVQELRELGISEEHIYVVARDHKMVESEHLHEAQLEDTSDLYGSFKRGLLIGGGLGLLGGFVLAVLAPPSMSAGFGTVILVALLGAALGAWASAMIGISVIEPHVERFEKAIDEGSLLVMADVPKDEELSVREAIREHHPEVLVDSAAMA